MTATNGVPAQQIASARPSRPAASANVDQTKNATTPVRDTAGFDALFSKLSGETVSAGQAGDAELAVAAGEIQARRLRETKPKALQVEETLPMEMLLTLFPQAQQYLASPTQPVAAPPAGLALPSAAAPQVGSDNPAALALPAASLALPAVSATPADFAGEMADTAASTGTAQPQVPGKAAAVADGAPKLAVTPDNRPAAPTPADAPPPAANASARTAPAPATAPAPFTSADATAARQMPSPAAFSPPAAPSAPAIQAAAQAALSAAPIVQPSLAPAAGRPNGPVAPQAMQPAPKPRDQNTVEAGKAGAAIESLAVLSREGESAAKGMERLREAQAAVTRQETVFGEEGQTPVAHQAAQRIIAALDGAQDLAPREAALVRREGETAPAAMTRVLHIQLQPADLGILNVQLSLRDQALVVKVDAAEHRTARLLEADREKLTDLLRSAGYVLDGVTIHITSSDKSVQNFLPQSGSGGDGLGQPGGQPQPGGAQADAQRGHGSRQDGDDRSSLARRSEEGDHAPRTGSADGDIYI